MKLGIMQPYFLPLATKIANSMICLPMYAGLMKNDVEMVSSTIKK